MERRSDLIGYITYGQHVLALSGELSARLDDIRVAILNREYQKLESLNQAITSLTQRLADADAKRFALAKRLGCEDRQYAKSIQARLKGKALQRIQALDTEIELTINQCKTKLTRQGSVMVMQHQALEEALGKHQLRVNV
ncbi:hypothetical protein A3712_03765 [Vibrio sp. HI00D65]|uniref:hypothetical protein n=1 Tax=Vibrio sp. HI00D65 TaxID=1822216 RepID=UPI0007B79024|nr:hypothetical protein [Vibrio sp. HI00D65]KZX59847.1 hypothetical protein A3712_03765 [Vibrio sp. HI00D65]